MNAEMKYNCTKISELLALYHYGELDHREAAELKKHLAACPGCSAGLEEIRFSLGLVSADAKYLAGAYGGPGSARARAAVMERLSKKRRLWPKLVPALAAAAVVVLIAVTGIFDNSPFKGATKTPAEPEVVAQAPDRAPSRPPVPADEQVMAEVEADRQTMAQAELPAEAAAPDDEVVTAQEDWELLENMELLANLEVLEDLELLEEMETL